MQEKYQIIYLNGPSSVGKTTIAKELQNQFDSYYLHLGIDTVIDMMPEKTNDWRLCTKVPGFSWEPVIDTDGTVIYKPQCGEFGQKIVQALYIITAALAKEGYNLIIDDVSNGKKEVDIWKDLLRPYNVLWVGLTAPIKILEEREKKRADRQPGIAHWQAEHVHEGVIYDIMLDTGTTSVQENVEKIKKLVY